MTKFLWTVVQKFRSSLDNVGKLEYLLFPLATTCILYSGSAITQKLIGNTFAFFLKIHENHKTFVPQNFYCFWHIAKNVMSLYSIAT